MDVLLSIIEPSKSVQCTAVPFRSGDTLATVNIVISGIDLLTVMVKDVIFTTNGGTRVSEDVNSCTPLTLSPEVKIVTAH